MTEDVNVTADSPAAAPPEPGSVEEVLVQLGDGGFNGIVVIDDDGELNIANYGTADGPRGPSIDENTVFDIGSITKQFTGAAIVRLEMDGLVSVDERVGAYLPELSGPLSDVTLHQLLTHSAGLPDGIGDDYEEIDRAAYLERAMARMGAPGEFRYSNTGYSLLGMVIESVTGNSYERYLREALFEPAGMESTGYVLPDWDLQNVAVGYDGTTRLSAPNEMPWAEDGPWWNLRANGGILSTAADMRRWDRALRDDSILSDAAKDKLFARHISEGDGASSYYGYGWVSFPLGDDDWFLGHNGGNGIFFADMLRFPEDKLMIFVASNTSGADEDVAFRLAGRLTDGATGAVCTPLADPTSFPSIGAFPPTDAGMAAEAMTTILLGGDEAARRAFAERHVSSALAGGLSLDEQIAELALLQEEFMGHRIESIHRQDSTTLHVVMRGPESPGPLVLSITADLDDPIRIACVNIDQS